MPEEWQKRSLGKWHLACHPDARLAQLQTDKGEHVGWVMEPMLQTVSGKATPYPDIVRLGGDGPVDDALVERSLYGRNAAGHSDGTGLEGMWIAIVLTANFERIYLGPIHSAVFERSTRRVATSHNLLAPFSRNLELSKSVDPLATQNYYSFGLTAFDGIERLLPNHYLDLHSFEPVRHWPKSTFRTLDGPTAAGRMIDHGRRIVKDIANGQEMVIPLSAGNDSRAVLAMARPFAQLADCRLSAFTTVGNDFGRKIDAQAAVRLAEIADIPHDVRPRPAPRAVPRTEVLKLHARLGEAKAGPILLNPKLHSREPMPENLPLTLAGMGGELGRAVLWAQEEHDEITAEMLLKLTKTPVLPITLAKAQHWLDGLPSFVRANPYDILDLSYLEQRLGCWEANSRYLFPGRPNTFSFMTSGYCIEAMLSLPVSYRRSERLQVDMTAHGWPELLSVPINRAVGTLWIEGHGRRLLGPAKRQLKDLGSRMIKRFGRKKT